MVNIYGVLMATLTVYIDFYMNDLHFSIHIISLVMTMLMVYLRYPRNMINIYKKWQTKSNKTQMDFSCDIYTAEISQKFQYVAGITLMWYQILCESNENDWKSQIPVCNLLYLEIWYTIGTWPKKPNKIVYLPFFNVFLFGISFWDY